MKILLVKPYTELRVARRLQESFLHLEPLELEIVAGGVPEDDDVRILDLSLEKKPKEIFESALRSFLPDMIGFSGYSTTAHIVKLLAENAKKILPRAVTLVGGIHATIAPEDYAHSSLDVIVRGEGGGVMGELARRYKSGEPLWFGGQVLSRRDPCFLTKARSAPPEYPPVNSIPLPRRDLVDRKRYFCVWTHSETRSLPTLFPRVASMRTSLGCVFTCSFCVIHHLMGGKYLQRSPEDVVREISGIQEEHIYFVDDEMFLNIPRVTRIAGLLKEQGIRKRYISWARSDTIVKHPEVFELWKSVGLDVVYVGLESVDESRLAEYSKRTSVEINRRAVQILKSLNIMLHAAYIVHPDFTAGDFRRLEEEIRAITPAEITFTVLSPSPGTRFWQDNKQRFICDPYRYYDCMHTILPAFLPLRRFYRHFGRLTSLALRANPLRVNRIRVPFTDFVRAVAGGTRYIFSLYTIYKDYRKP
ncbi:MAG: radical SAM protein [Candidatus Omnitrophica bacterium]|nr:radical SAM protein [Candidatus Omnitrophota bacterium]